MPQPAPSEDLDASVEREDPSRDPTCDEAEDDILGSSPDFRSTGENSELGDAGLASAVASRWTPGQMWGAMTVPRTRS
jgi:hypothetical protein